MSRVSHAVSSCVLEEVKNLVLSQRRLSEQGVHVKEEQCQDHAPEKLEKPRRSLKPAHGEWRRPSWARRARTGGKAGSQGPRAPHRITAVDSFILVTYKKPVSQWRHSIAFVCFLEQSGNTEKHKTRREHNGLFRHQQQTLQCLGYLVMADSFVFVLRFFFFLIQMRLFWVHNLLV